MQNQPLAPNPWDQAPQTNNASAQSKMNPANQASNVPDSNGAKISQHQLYMLRVKETSTPVLKASIGLIAVWLIASVPFFGLLAMPLTLVAAVYWIYVMVSGGFSFCFSLVSAAFTAPSIGKALHLALAALGAVALLSLSALVGYTLLSEFYHLFQMAEPKNS